MALVKTKIVAKAGSPRYELTIDWEHGDADLTTHDTHTILGECETALQAWVDKFKECREAINAARWYSAPFSRGDWERELNMELAYDAIYDSCSTPPAASIDKIVFIDGDGNQYKVTGY